MDHETLRIFIAVASELSITNAAARLGRAASNVTTRIQQLESHMGVALFVRAGKRFTLSTAGERFLDYAQRLLALEEEARHVVSGGTEGGTLRLGSMESAAASRLPAPLASFHQKQPTTRLELTTGPSVTLMEQVRSGRLDCAFVSLPSAQANSLILEEAGLSASRIWMEDMILLLPSTDHAARTPAQVRCRSLAAFRQGCTYRALAEDALGIRGGSDWRMHELGSYHAMIACVAAGASVAVMPRSVLDLAPLPAVMKSLRLGKSATHLVWRKGFSVPAFELFRQHMKEERA